LILIGIFSALAYVAMVAIHIPIPGFPPFLTLDFKDAIIAVAGFVLGPLAVVAIAVVVAILEMMTVSEAGYIGAIMNASGTIAFAGVAALIYRANPSFRGALMGAIAGTAALTVVMLAMNYVITPIYMGVPRASVVAMLVPIFLPFNVIKGAANSVLLLLLYRPIIRGLEIVRNKSEE